MGPLMKTAKLWVAALMSSCSFETVNFAIKSSKTLIDSLFPAIFPVVAGVDGVSTEGMVEEKKRRGREEGLKKSKSVDKRFEIFALAQKESGLTTEPGFSADGAQVVD
jgi:hypothetical protein